MGSVSQHQPTESQASERGRRKPAAWVRTHPEAAPEGRPAAWTDTHPEANPDPRRGGRGGAVQVTAPHRPGLGREDANANGADG